MLDIVTLYRYITGTSRRTESLGAAAFHAIDGDTMVAPALRKRSRAPTRSPGRPKWMKPFLAELANSSNVSAAARAGKIDTSTVYDRRRKDAEFNREWQVALCEGYDNLEMETLFRLRTGEIKPAAGAKKGVRQFDNALALRLLLAHRDSATRERSMRAHENAVEVRAAIDAKIEEMRERVLARRALPAPADTGE